MRSKLEFSRLAYVVQVVARLFLEKNIVSRRRRTPIGAGERVLPIWFASDIARTLAAAEECETMSFY